MKEDNKWFDTAISVVSTVSVIMIVIVCTVCLCLIIVNRTKNHIVRHAVDAYIQKQLELLENSPQGKLDETNDLS